MTEDCGQGGLAVELAEVASAWAITVAVRGMGRSRGDSPTPSPRPPRRRKWPRVPFGFPSEDLKRRRMFVRRAG